MSDSERFSARARLTERSCLTRDGRTLCGMHATIHRSPSADRLRAALLPGAGCAIEAAIGACLSESLLTVGLPGEACNVVLTWWDGKGTLSRPLAGIPLVALCAGGPDLLASALRAGADAAFGLPVTTGLLRAAALAHSRTLAQAAPPPRTKPKAARPPILRLDRRAHTLSVHDRHVSLTLREFDLLAFLIDHAGDACSRDELLSGVWGIDFETGTNTVDVFVYALRRKLDTCGLTAAIETVRGVGYRLSSDLV